MSYQAPLSEIQFVMHELAGLEQVSALPGCEEASADVVAAVLEEAAKFATDVLEPLSASGDREGATRLPDGSVRTPAGFRDAYRQYCENGWNGLAKRPEYGGQGLPHLVATGVEEMWHAANLAFDLCPMLTQAAIEAIELKGTPELKARFLPPMVAGTWAGTMNLTEPQAGSDLAAVRMRAVPQGNGTYKLFGQKIFITYGEQDFTENIVHLVLARTPDAPEGVKGISLFVVPKVLVDGEGALGERNDVRCVSLEHKLGIHASPTAVMAYGDAGGAVGYLLGEENRGLEYMFIVMNLARFAVGLEGLGMAERAYQRAVAYARERVQGRAVGIHGVASILEHPDVRRMLMTMRARTEAMRAVAYVTAAAMDHAERASGTDARAARGFVDFLIPIVKGWSTESAQEIVSLGLQVHGGAGFIEEAGAAQDFRDARIITLYEGTTGIQANDLIGRKTARDGGTEARRIVENMAVTARSLLHHDDARLVAIGTRLAEANDAVLQGIDFIVAMYGDSPRAAFAAAVPYLELWGTVAGGWQMGRAALIAADKLNAGNGDARFLRAKITTAHYYAEAMLPRAAALVHALKHGSSPLLAMDAEAF